MPKFKLTKEQELEVVERYKNGESIRKIAEDYPVGRTSIGYVLQRNNVERKGQGNSYGYTNKKYTINKDYFETIDSEEKAYWLGFISADGHVSDEGIIIALNNKDVNHLDKFLKAIGSNSKIHEDKRNNAVRVSVYSKKMVSDLRKLGLRRDKSKTMMYPTLRPDLHKHFIRGLFDGDGCISKGRIDFSGSIEIVVSIKTILMNMFDLRDAPVQKRGNNFAVVAWYKNRHLIYDFMYKGANVYLERKYSKYINEFEREG